jgi:hypothetical protein
VLPNCCGCVAYRPAHDNWIPPADLLRALGLSEYAAEAERFAWCSWEFLLRLVWRIYDADPWGASYQRQLLAALMRCLDAREASEMQCRRDWPAFAAALRARIWPEGVR